LFGIFQEDKISTLSTLIVLRWEKSAKILVSLVQNNHSINVQKLIEVKHSRPATGLSRSELFGKTSGTRKEKFYQPISCLICNQADTLQN
jgi:hypothetical protein